MSAAARSEASLPGRGARRLLIAVPFAWLGLFFALPFLRVLAISFSEPVIAQPPYQALFAWNADGQLVLQATLASYRLIAADLLYLKAYGHSIEVAFGAAVGCLVLGYPMAYALTRVARAWRGLALLLIVLPFWTSFLLRVYAWIGLLSNHGTINNGLLALGLIDHPLTLLKTDFAVYLGIIYAYLPFMILPLYASLEKLDRSLLEAAADLGCRPLRAFFTITLPLSLPGVIAGFALVFIPALGEFVIPDLLGGADTLMIGRVLWEEFFANRAWPVASALAVLMLALVSAVMALQSWLQRRGQLT